VLVLRDGFPTSPGHTLIVPRRHVASFVALGSDERSKTLEALSWARVKSGSPITETPLRRV
jgi:diadenosine tetraphosphate (Ap4A) HIT family hydrolase